MLSLFHLVWVVHVYDIVISSTVCLWVLSLFYLLCVVSLDILFHLLRVVSAKISFHLPRVVFMNVCFISKFQNFDDIFFWKGQESIHSFRFKRMSNEDIVTYLYLIDTIMIYWVWTSFNWKNEPHIFLYQRQIWLINLLSRVSLSRTGRIPEWCLSIRMTTKIIIV